MNYAIYKTATGEIQRIVNCDDPQSQCQDGEAFIEGEADDITYYVKDNEFVYRGPPPSRYDVWDGSAWVDPRTEQQKYDDAAQQVRIKRNALLYESDWTDLVGAEQRLGETVWQEWQTYRQQLRDVTDQPGFPFNIVWPTKPQ